MGIAKPTPSLSWRRTKAQRQCDLVWSEWQRACLLMAGMGVLRADRRGSALRLRSHPLGASPGWNIIHTCLFAALTSRVEIPSWIGHWVSASGSGAPFPFGRLLLYVSCALREQTWRQAA